MRRSYRETCGPGFGPPRIICQLCTSVVKPQLQDVRAHDRLATVGRRGGYTPFRRPVRTHEEAVWAATTAPWCGVLRRMTAAHRLSSSACTAPAPRPFANSFPT